MNKYILIYERYILSEMKMINFDNLLSKILCSYHKANNNVILIASKDHMFEELSKLFVNELQGFYIYVLLDISDSKNEYFGWTQKETWDWLNKYFSKSDKDKNCVNCCLDMNNFLDCKDIIS